MTRARLLPVLLLAAFPASAPSRAQTPPPALQWDGLQSAATPIPDVHLAVGPGNGAAGRVIEATNRDVAIYDKSGSGLPLAVRNLDAMFLSGGPASNVFDPKVLYDQHSGRFFIVALEFEDTLPLYSRIHLAVSASSAPSNLTTDWTFLNGTGVQTYTLPGPTLVDTWADYPGIGADSDSLFVTTTQFEWPPTYRGANIRVFDKAQLLAGFYTFQDITFPAAVPGPGGALFTTGVIQPAHVFGTTATGGFYLISRVNLDWFRLYEVSGDPASPTATAAMFSWSPGRVSPDAGADQCTIGADPDVEASHTARVISAVYRDDHLWCTLQADPDNDSRVEAVWQRIQPSGGSPLTMVRGGFIDQGGNTWTYNPSIAVNSDGAAVMTFTESSDDPVTGCPSVSYAVKPLPGLPQFEPPQVARGSTSFFNATPGVPVQRWGDYSATVVDPDDGCFWFVNEYVESPTTWGSHIAEMCLGPVGACCLSRNICANLNAAACGALPNGTFRGAGTSCPTQNVVPGHHAAGAATVHWVDPAVDCYSIVLARGPEPPCNPDFKIDPWITSEEPHQPTCQNFGAGPDSPPIPPDFFAPGSEPFFGQVCYAGEPLGSTSFGDFGIADTLVQRQADPFDRCAVPSDISVDVPIQIVALNLRSVAPIQVIINDEPTLWNVRVDLSELPSPQGVITATKTHCNGGTWTSVLPVQARLTFSNVENGEVRVLDTGFFGLPPVLLQTAPNEWVHAVDPALNLAGAACTEFHPGIADPPSSQTAACDCNANGQHDTCDLEQGSLDANQNGVPDVCDPDSDGDGILDFADNCPYVPNPGQENADQDPHGDVCDPCPLLVEALEGDQDGDKAVQGADIPMLHGDNCPCVPNYGQHDTDLDTVGDACDVCTDTDADGFGNPGYPASLCPPDNCPAVFNPDQIDSDGDGLGDACDLALPGSGKVAGLTLERAGLGGLALTWGASCAAGDDDYAVYTGTPGGTFDGHTALTCSTFGATSLTTGLPPGDAYYLVVPLLGGAHEGSYGLRTSGERPPSGSACLPQQLLSCP